MEREERKARRREELARIKQAGQERRERERQEERERKLSAEDIFAAVARYAGVAFLVYSYVLGMGRMGNMVVYFLGNNLLGWLVCGGVGLFLNVGLAMAIMRMKGRGLS